MGNRNGPVGRSLCRCSPRARKTKRKQRRDGKSQRTWIQSNTTINAANSSSTQESKHHMLAERKNTQLGQQIAFDTCQLKREILREYMRFCTNDRFSRQIWMNYHLLHCFIASSHCDRNVLYVHINMLPIFAVISHFFFLFLFPISSSGWFEQTYQNSINCTRLEFNHILGQKMVLALSKSQQWRNWYVT